jgi:hypothetical protein
MKSGSLASIRWVPPKAPLAALASKKVAERVFAVTGIPRPPTSMTVWDEARFFLRAAAEVEHSLLVQYLYAKFSLLDTSPGQNWAGELLGVAIQEMCHLITVQNLLLALGKDAQGISATPYLDRQHPFDYSIPFTLEPLSQRSLAKYITTEAPTLDHVLPISKRQLVAQIEVIANLPALGVAVGSVFGPLAARAMTIKQVGALYALLYWLFLPTDTVQGPWPKKDFPGDLFAAELPGRHLPPEQLSGLADKRQAEEDAWGGDPSPDVQRFVLPVRSAGTQVETNSALDAIYQIALQGEGWQDMAKSHFNRFLALWKPLDNAMHAGGAASFRRSVPINPSVDPAKPGTVTITNKVSVLWASLFNTRYQMLLMKIYLALARPSDQPGQGPASRLDLIQKAIALEMSVGVSAIADKLVELPLKLRAPAGTTDPADKAGPPFELPDAPLPETPKSQCQRLIDLIDEAAGHMKALKTISNADPDKPTPNDLAYIVKPLSDDDAALRPALIQLLPTLP